MSFECGDVSNTSVDDETGHAARLRGGRQHLTPVAELPLVAHVDHQRTARRRPRDAYVDGEVVAGSAPNGERRSREHRAGPGGTNAVSHGPPARLAERRRAQLEKD